MPTGSLVLMFPTQGQPDRLPCFRLVRSRRKTLELRVYPDGTLEVRAPQRMSRQAIECFVAQRQQWIRQKRREMVFHEPLPPWRCESDAELFLFGEKYRLCLEVAAKKYAYRDTKRIYLGMPEGDEAAYRARLVSYLRAQARATFERQIQYWFPFFADRGHVPPQLRIKIMKTRWGSLSSKGNINLNLLLVHYPLDCIESVVVHELCHLEHMNHGAGFKQLQAALLPDWRQRKARLEAFGRQLPKVL